MDGDPKASSTPKIVPQVKGRRGIRNDDMLSPIEALTYGKMTQGQKDTENEAERTDTEDQFLEGSNREAEIEEKSNGTQKYKSEETEQNSNWQEPVSLIIGIVTVLVLIVAAMCTDLLGEAKPEIASVSLATKLSHKFTSQKEDFWLSVEVAIHEINQFHKPRSIIFLYQDESVETLEEILEEISAVAVCKISSCSSTPIILNENDLSTKDVLEDYGKVIADNKEKLQENGVMIIKNLEKVPAVSAQAFHSLCDEENPVVSKALFLFTIKHTHTLPERSMKYVETLLRHRWGSIHDDIFYPLFTRISGTVLEITKEP